MVADDPENTLAAAVAVPLVLVLIVSCGVICGIRRGKTQEAF